jgi:ABC-2 type transport system ATP-binding protein
MIRPAMSNSVELEHVTKRFGSFTAVDDLSLVVPDGSVYGFIGPNGSGKTTTLRMISRIYIPDQGVVRVLGEERHGAANDKVFYLPEERAIYPSMKVREAIQFFARLKGYEPSRQEINDWLDRVELPGVAEKKMNQLSKGMSQKVQFLAAVISKPKLAMLDEPFSGLDPINAAVVRDLIRTLADSGTTVIFSTHDMRMAEEMCDYVFMIYKGRKVLDGTLDQIHQQYGQDIIRTRVGEMETGVFQGLSGVESVAHHGNHVELRISKGADTQAILQMLMSRGRVAQFEVTNPSLQDIFIRIAAPTKEAIATLG